MFRFGFKSGRGRLPRQDLLIYLARPNSDEFLIGEDTEIGEDTYIWGYVLPDDSDIRDATGWASGTANIFYDAVGAPIVVLATEINRAILPFNVVWYLTSETQQTGRLAIYSPAATSATIDKARSVLRDDSIDHLFLGNAGIWYDPQDLTTMYQNATGTLPVYRPGSGAVDPPVGLLLDKSQGLELGPELISNGDFSNGSTGWTVANTDATHYVTFADGAARYVSDTTSPQLILEQSSVMVIGQWYEIAVVTKPGGSGSVKIEGQAGILVFTAGSDVVARIKAVGPTLSVVRNTTNVDVTIDSISIREIKGYHAYQSTTTARPTLSGRYSILTATETLSTQSVTTVATNYTLSFSGTGTITLSGTATGTYSAGTHTITCTAGTLTCTVAGSVTKADLRRATGQVLPVYQAVVNANTYDTAGFPLYLRRDLTDDKHTLIVPTGGITGTRLQTTLDSVTPTTETMAAGTFDMFAVPSAGPREIVQWLQFNKALSASELAMAERFSKSRARLV